MTTPPRSRSNAESHLYMDLHPCHDCGSADFGGYSAVGDGPHGPQVTYSGPCQGCGRPRTFTFLVPDEPLLPVGFEFAPADAGPSQLLDPGEWLAVADDFVDQAADAPPDSGDRAAGFASAAAAIDEVLRFGDPGDERVPATLIRSELGRAVHDAEPGRLRRARLEAARRGYRAEAGEDVAEPAGDPVVPRSHAEELAYLQATPCVCGALFLDADEFAVAFHDGEPAVLYQAPCESCGRGRAYWFREPRHAGSFEPAGHGYGPPGGEPSAIVDAGQWLVLADTYGAAAETVERLGPGGDGDEAFHGAVAVLASAVAALDEVLRFVPGPAARVPAGACWTPLGTALYRDQPARFERTVLLAERDRRAAALAAFLATHPEPPPGPAGDGGELDEGELSWRP